MDEPKTVTLKWKRILPGQYRATAGDGRRWIVGKNDASGYWEVYGSHQRLVASRIPTFTEAKWLVEERALSS